MRKEAEQMREALLGKLDIILEEICSGQDVELRRAANGGLKVLAVRKKLIEVSDRG